LPARSNRACWRETDLAASGVCAWSSGGTSWRPTTSEPPSCSVVKWLPPTKRRETVVIGIRSARASRWGGRRRAAARAPGDPRPRKDGRARRMRMCLGASACVRVRPRARAREVQSGAAGGRRVDRPVDEPSRWAEQAERRAGPGADGSDRSARELSVGGGFLVQEPNSI
jgi:hypothetical protein